MLAFLGWDWAEVVTHFAREFYPWELINEIGAMNSGVKSRVQYEIELSSAIGRVVE